MVSFNVPAYPAQSFKASIKRISREIDAKTRTMSVELDVPNRDGNLSLGSFSDVQWPVDRNYPTMFVPVSPSRAISDTCL